MGLGKGDDERVEGECHGAKGQNQVVVSALPGPEAEERGGKVGRDHT